VSYRLLDVLPVGVLLVGSDWRIRYINTWLCERLQREADTLVGRRLVDAFPDLEDRGLTFLMERALEGGEQITLSARLHRYIFKFPPSLERSDLDYMPQSATVIPVEGLPGKGLLILVQDVSERVLTERAYLHQIARLEALQQVNMALANLDLDACLRTVVQQASRLFAAQQALLYLRGQGVWAYEAKSGQIVTAATPDSDNPPGISWVLEHGRSLLVHDIGEEEEAFQALSPRVRSMMAVPLQLHREMAGVLEVGCERGGAYTSEDLAMLEMMATQAAIAIHNAELHTREVRQRQIAETLRDIGVALSTSLEPEAILDVLLDATARVLPYDAASVMLIKGDYAFVNRWRGHDRFGPADWIQHFRIRVSDWPNLLYMYETHRPKHIADVRQDPEWVGFKQVSYVRSWVGAPILSRSQVLGFLSLDSIQPGFYSAKDGEVLAALAAQVGVALDNAMLYKRQAKLARTDGLTGLPNRRRFDEDVEREVLRALRFGRPVSLLMVDLDDFKLYNDAYGHPAGDEVLRALAQVLRQHLRSVDIPARYGGEEFAVILPETDLEQALEVAERLREHVALMHVPFNLKQPITVSIGVATLPRHAMKPETLVEAADQALYAAKQAGKNQVRPYVPGLKVVQEEA